VTAVVYSKTQLQAGVPAQVWIQTYANQSEKDAIVAKATAERKENGGVVLDLNFTYTTIKPFASNVWNGKNLNDTLATLRALRVGGGPEELITEIQAAVDNFIAAE
jgi:hypothetical protein